MPSQPTHTIMSHSCLSVSVPALPCLMSRTKLSVLRPEGSPASPRCCVRADLQRNQLAPSFVCVAGWLPDRLAACCEYNRHSLTFVAMRCTSTCHIFLHGMACIASNGRTSGRNGQTWLSVAGLSRVAGLLVASCHNAYITSTHTSHHMHHPCITHLWPRPCLPACLPCCRLDLSYSSIYAMHTHIPTLTEADKYTHDFGVEHRHGPVSCFGLRQSWRRGAATPGRRR